MPSTLLSMERIFRIFIYSTLIVIAPTILSCRDRSTKQKTIEAPLTLIPKLHEDLAKLRAITIQEGSQSVSLISKAGTWYVDKPYDSLASAIHLNLALSELIKATRGQPVTLTDKDYTKLNLTTHSEVSSPSSNTLVSLSFDNGREDVELVLGNYDIPENSQNAQVYGDAAVARRYVRLPQENKVFLTSATLDSFRGDPITWLNSEFPPIKRLKSLTYKDSEGFSWEASRKSSFGEITYSAPFSEIKQSATLAKLFENLFANGYFDGVVPSSSKQDTPEQVIYTLTATDFFGGTYQLQVYQDDIKYLKNRSQQQLRRGLISFDRSTGNTVNLVRCRLDIQLEEASETAKSQIAQLTNRDIHFDISRLHNVNLITEQLQQAHEQN